MPNDIAVLPPDPDKPGRYWMTRTGWNIGKRVEIWEWSPAEPLWRHEQWGPMSPDLAGKAGYTLATRHRILTPGELDYIHLIAQGLEDEAKAKERSGSATDLGAAAAFLAAAAMLRAALGGGA